jgi:hypothetical protein
MTILCTSNPDTIFRDERKNSRLPLAPPFAFAGGDLNWGRTLTTSTLTWTSKPLNECRCGLTGSLDCPPVDALFNRKVLKAALLFSFTMALFSLPDMARSQSVVSSGDPALSAESTISAKLEPTYVRPTQRIMANNYVFDAFGPYPIAGAAFAAGINQFTNSPPEWHQGVEGYSKRFGSDFGIAAVGTTTRYGLAEALKQDTLYYRCECRGVFPRLRHAVLATVTARRGDDGHRVFSIPALVAPYAGSMAAVYGWYPNRFDAMDGFRIGNYNMLAYVGGNIALEFFYSGPHSLLSRMHLNNSHGSPEPGPNH